MLIVKGVSCRPLPEIPMVLLFSVPYGELAHSVVAHAASVEGVGSSSSPIITVSAFSVG